MVKGLELFKTHFQGYSDQYVLIGGTACTILMDRAGLEFRATRDLDMVLYVEALKPEFLKAFWEFIKSGGYQQRQESTGKKVFYRFSHPSKIQYPIMIELFSRSPDALQLPPEAYLTPIHADDSSI